MNSALTRKLLGHLHRIFDKDPGKELSLRIRYQPGTMNWIVVDGTLTINVDPPMLIGPPLLLNGTWALDGSEALDGVAGVIETYSVTVVLCEYTISSLADYIAGLPGMVVVFESADMGHLCGGILIDGAGDQDQTNGDHLYAFTSLLWAYMSSLSYELAEAAISIAEMLKQMSIRLASGEWLDEHGGYYKVPRILGESDTTYGLRIIAETLRPKGNNKAIEVAIYEATGMRSSVVDAATYTLETTLFDGTWNYDGTRNYASASADSLRCMFDVLVEYDLLGSADVIEHQAAIAEQVDRLRDAGTHMRQIGIGGDSAITDDYDYPMSDYAEISVVTRLYYDGSARFDGTALFSTKPVSTDILN